MQMWKAKNASFERLADDEVASCGWRVGEAGSLVGFGDRGEPASDGARRQCGCAIGNVEGYGLGCRWKRRQLVLTAPGLEVAPVVSISLECGGGLGCGNEGLGLLDQFFNGDGLRDKGVGVRLHVDFLSRRHRCAEFRGDRNSRFASQGDEGEG